MSSLFFFFFLGRRYGRAGRATICIVFCTTVPRDQSVGQRALWQAIDSVWGLVRNHSWWLMWQRGMIVKELRLTARYAEMLNDLVCSVASRQQLMSIDAVHMET